MIKPPFTVLILKDSYHPVTIRVTKRMVFSLFLTILVLFGVAMYGILHYLPHDYTRFASSNVDNKSSEKEYILLEYKKDENSKTVDLPEPEVKELSIQEINDGEIEMEFTFANIPDNHELFVWIIINPEAETAGEMIIYPRSPVFRGLPVDYRNGSLYNQSDKKYLKASFSGLMIGIDFTQFRILAYSKEGNIIVDKLYNIQKNIRM